MSFYLHEIKPNLCLLISFLHYEYFYNWLCNLYPFLYVFCKHKMTKHCYEVENGITAVRSVPDFCSRIPRLNECDRPRKKRLNRLRTKR